MLASFLYHFTLASMLALVLFHLLASMLGANEGLIRPTDPLLSTY